MSKERMQFLVDEVNLLTKKKEEMKLKNIPLWNWPNQEGKLVEMYVDEITLLKEQNNKEEQTMTTKKETNKKTEFDRIPNEIELLNQLINHATKEEEETNMTTDNNKELIAAKGLVIGVNQLATSNLLGEVESKRLSVTVQEVAAALVSIEKAEKCPVNLKERVTKKLGNETYKSIIKRGGNRKMFNKVWETITNTANEYYLTNKEEEQTMVKMDLQFFGSKIKEETEMLEQIEKFRDIAKTIEKIDEAGEDIQIAGVKVSWEGVKQFIYGLDDEELEFLAYSSHLAIPAEMEVYSLYLLEAEKAWDNELTLQNAYFNSKENYSWAYSSF